MVEYNDTQYWFNVKANELTLKIDDIVYKVAKEHVNKESFLMLSDKKDEIWFNTTKSGKAYRTYINDKIHLVSKMVLNNVITEEYKGTTLQTIKE